MRTADDLNVEQLNSEPPMKVSGSVKLVMTRNDRPDSLGHAGGSSKMGPFRNLPALLSVVILGLSLAALDTACLPENIASSPESTLLNGTGRPVSQQLVVPQGRRLAFPVNLTPGDLLQVIFEVGDAPDGAIQAYLEDSESNVVWGPKRGPFGTFTCMASASGRFTLYLDNTQGQSNTAVVIYYKRSARRDAAAP